nr:acetyl-CoA carboxylase biotin carboxyl carrier protein [uncultured Mediterraneibacter sp.]
MEFEQLLKLIEKVSEAKLDRFSYREGDLELKMGMNAQKDYERGIDAETVSDAKVSESEETKKDFHKASGEAQYHDVKSPLVGVFYEAPSEGAEPYVKVGDSVKKGQVLGIVEAMKLMNEIECEYDGTVVEIPVQNGDTVEYGQTLFVIRP